MLHIQFSFLASSVGLRRKGGCLGFLAAAASRGS